MIDILDDEWVGFTCSTFDLLHAGHVLMLEECKGLCDVLIVGLQVDPSVDRTNKHRPVQSIYERWVQLRGCKYVDHIIPYSTEADLLNLLVTQPIDVRFVGLEYLNKDFTGKHLGMDIRYNTRDHSWSSSELRERVGQQYDMNNKIDDVDHLSRPYAKWADGTVCELDEIDEYLRFMSDDYRIVGKEMK